MYQCIRCGKPLSTHPNIYKMCMACKKETFSYRKCKVCGAAISRRAYRNCGMCRSCFSKGLRRTRKIRTGRPSKSFDKHRNDIIKEILNWKPPKKLKKR